MHTLTQEGAPHTSIHFDGGPQVLPLLPELGQPVPQGLLPLQQLLLLALQQLGVGFDPVLAIFVLVSILKKKKKSHKRKLGLSR